jgi:hypothetical protein
MSKPENKPTVVDFKTLTLTNLQITMHPHKGGAREDGTVKLSWRERWEQDGVPSMFYSVTGDAVINGVTKRISTAIPAVKDGILYGLGTERTDKYGNNRIISKYPAPQSIKCRTDKDGALVLEGSLPILEESLPVDPDGNECPLEYGLSFLMFTKSHKGLVLRDVVITKEPEPGEEGVWADVHALGGHTVVDVGIASGAPLTGGFAVPNGKITRRAARDTRAAAPATVDRVS